MRTGIICIICLFVLTACATTERFFTELHEREARIVEAWHGVPPETNIDWAQRDAEITAAIQRTIDRVLYGAKT